MALWNDTTAPKWLLGVDPDDATKGLGNNGIKNVKTLNGVDIPAGNELAMADDDEAIGWRIWHSKENGKKIGEGRGWWEIVATQDVTGNAVVAVDDPVVEDCGDGDD